MPQPRQIRFEADGEAPRTPAFRFEPDFKADEEESPIGGSSYDNVPDDKLNLFQKGERGLQRFGLIKPGMELFSPEAMKQKGLAAKTAIDEASLGYYPQLKALKETGSFSSPEYIAERDKQREQIDQAGLGTKLVGKATGLLPSLVVPNANTVNGIAATTGLAGFLSNPGDTPGEINPTQFNDRAVRGTVSGLLGGSLASVPKAIPKIADKLKSSSSMRALKQSGAMLGDFRKLSQPEKVAMDEAGQILHDFKVMSPGATPEKIAARSEKAMDSVGKVLGKVYDTLDAKMPQGAERLLPTRRAVYDEIKSKVIAPLRDATATEHLAAPLEDFAERFLRKGPDGPVSFGQLRKELSGLDKISKWGKGGAPTHPEELIRKIRGVVNGEIEKSVEKIGEAIGFPLYDHWKRAKQSYSVLKDVNKIATDKTFRETANRFISPSDYGTALATGIATAAGGGAPLTALLGSVAAGAANRGMRKYGNAVSSVAANKMSKSLMRLKKSGLLDAAEKSILPGTFGLLNSTKTGG